MRETKSMPRTGLFPREAASICVSENTKGPSASAQSSQ